ncbi:MAG: C40 family peptidase [Acidimicrobiales bacterium]
MLIGVTGTAALLVAIVMGALVAVVGRPPGLAGGEPSALASSDIPPVQLALYRAAAETCPGLPWAVLAAIGKVESDHGRSNEPGVHYGANQAGAEGPMQFLPATFAAYAVAGTGAGDLDVYEPTDAVFSAARYLCANGGGDAARLHDAIFAYNHAEWYVQDVLAWARAYAGTPGGPGAPAPSGDQGAASVAIRFATAALGAPYRWGGQGDDGTYDCSGLVQRAYEAAGVALPRVAADQYAAGPRLVSLAELAPGDLVFFATQVGDPATIHHVGIYLGRGEMIDAPHTGAVVRVEPLWAAELAGATRPWAAAQPSPTSLAAGR